MAIMYGNRGYLALFPSQAHYRSVYSIKSRMGPHISLSFTDIMMYAQVYTT
jgi:hypothetical protein